MILYILPTPSLILGAIVGSGLHKQLGIGETGAAILFGFAGLILGFTIAGLISKRQTANSKLIPVITRIIKPTVGFHPAQIQTGFRGK
jgi:positive regulator of sigma E activity